MKKKRIRTGLRGLLTGALFGSAIGILYFSLVTLTTDRSATFGSPQDWLLLAVLVGLAFGAGIGAVIGALIGFAQADWSTAVIIGNLIGLPLAASQVTGGDLVYMPASTGMHALEVLVCCQVLGLLVALTLKKHFPTRNDRDPIEGP